jgi:ribosomal protein L22
MDFNPSKCSVLRIMPSQKKKARETNYSLHGQTLEVTSDSKYLGVTINSTLTWSKHVDTTAGKANRALGFLRRNINDCNTRVKAAAYITMVRPIMEYASSAWDPHTKKDAQKLESVQRRAARFACNNYRDKTPGCVDNMLQSLQWNSLEERRKTNRLIMLHKINNGLVGIDKGQYLKHSDPRTRGAQRFYQHRADHVVLANSFFPRTLREWNSLPVHITANIKTETFRVGLGSLGPGHFPTTD